jgi:hypothetical protein
MRAQYRKMEDTIPAAASSAAGVSRFSFPFPQFFPGGTKKPFCSFFASPTAKIEQNLFFCSAAVCTICEGLH